MLHFIWRGKDKRLEENDRKKERKGDEIENERWGKKKKRARKEENKWTERGKRENERR